MTTLKPSFVASTNFTLTALYSLASDTNLLAGWQSDIVDQSTDLAVDQMISGFFKTAASGLTASRVIHLFAYGSLDDAGTYPDTLTGAGQATKTLTSTEIQLAGALARLGTVTINATASQIYPFQFSLVNDGFGFIPRKWGVFVVHNTGNAFPASGMQITRTPQQYTNA